MKIAVYNKKGESAGEMQLPKRIFGAEVNLGLVHQAAVIQSGNSRQVLADARTKDEVRGGGRKPWRQKGTGRARHGSSRSPIWRGGGVTFGPTSERNFSKKINKKAKQKALFMALTQKVEDKEVVVIDEFNLSEAKTKEAFGYLRNILKLNKSDKMPSVLLVADNKDGKNARAVSNIQRVSIINPESLNILEIVNNKIVVITKGAIKKIEDNFKKA